jgi:hypothetical protein
MKEAVIMGSEEQLKPILGELMRDEVEAIYLFGSHARGNAKPTSDIDICVLTGRNIPKCLKEEILSNSSRRMDISIFWDLPPAIRFRVLKEGKLLYKKDEIRLQRIKVDTLRSYLDIQPMIKKHCVRILGLVNDNV